eukprot:TRINITY_DN9635_c0_g1_i3.p1 TRINITY_DN9635_c0_g1~~TRINITY_DN9635_c0_g1_i3.p1  ORF type:complete len:157 (-),score=22.48 TRINITY_DN9635_c0_g1_i3:84-554(-)
MSASCTDQLPLDLQLASAVLGCYERISLRCAGEVGILEFKRQVDAQLGLRMPNHTAQLVLLELKARDGQGSGSKEARQNVAELLLSVLPRGTSQHSVIRSGKAISAGNDPKQRERSFELVPRQRPQRSDRIKADINSTQRSRESRLGRSARLGERA